MGVNYTQYAMVGVIITPEEKVISEAVYRTEPRFDTKTGKQTHEEKVLVKEETVEFEYKVGSQRFISNYLEYPQELYDKIEQYNKDNDTFIIINDIYDENGSICIGFNACHPADYGRVDLLEGELSLKDFMYHASYLAEAFDIDTEDVKLHFFSCIG